MITTQTSQSQTAAATNQTTARGSNGHGDPATLPRLVATPEHPDDRDALIRAVRGFFVGASHGLAAPAAGILPALLYPYRDTGHLRTDYPVCLSQVDGQLRCVPLTEQLEAWAEAAGSGRIVDDNLVRFERAIVDALGTAAQPVPARGVFEAAAAQLQEQLGLDGEAGDSLRGGLAAIAAQVSDDALLLGFSDSAAYNLSVACARTMVSARRARFAAAVRELANKLRAMIEVERSKDAASRQPDALASSLASAQFDASKLANVLGPHRGTSQADPERRERLESALATLEGYLGAVDSQPVATFLARDTAAIDAAGGDGVNIEQADDPSAAAIAEFDRMADELAAVLRAVRLARLEIEGNYDASAHADWLERLSWTGFSADELRLLTPVFAVEDPGIVTGAGLRGLSALLRSGKPVKVIVPLAAADDPAATDAFTGAVRFELGYFAISHREALVHQTAAARPVHLLDGLRRAMDATRSSLHVLAAATEHSTLGGWLHTGAAIDGRAHPMFCYDPEPGISWARRFELAGNNNPDADWPVGEVAFVGADGVATMEVAFTFADFALLEPGHRDQFALVPPGTPDEVLAPIAAWLELDDEASAPLVPYCWCVDGNGQLRRLAISAELAFACRDRQRFWRTLQEWAGVHNEHVERAVAAALAEAEAKHTEELERLATEHADAVAKVGREAAGEAMSKLAAALLDVDVEGLVGAVAPASSAAAAATPEIGTETAAAAQTETVTETETATETVAAAAAPSLSFDEPFIDTPLCTSCNDCLNINSVMFVYDDNKQAQIGDASAGTFEQLVQAAEKCPANCIHPGKPLNPDEPNLEELIARAAEYN